MARKSYNFTLIFSDFTVDSVNWASMKNLSDLLHENDQRFVLILDPAIPSEAGPDYKPARDQLSFRLRN